MKPRIALAAATIAVFTSPALAQEGRVYLQAGLGALILQDNDYTDRGRTWSGSYDPGPHATIALGYRFSEMVRVETEIGAGQVAYKLGEGGGRDRFGIMSGAVAGYLDIPVGLPFTPYLGAGAGWAVYAAQDTGSSGGFTAFGELGVSIPINADFAVVPGLRYTWLDRGDGYAGMESGWLPRIALRMAF